MANDFSWGDLDPAFAGRGIRFVSEAKLQGINVLVYCGRRSLADQAFLYRAGRTRAMIEAKARELEQDGFPNLAQILREARPNPARKKTTKAAPGESAHNYGLAFDCVPLVGGRAMWEDRKLFAALGEIGEACGLAWSGRWKSFLETGHFQDPEFKIDKKVFLETLSE